MICPNCGTQNASGEAICMGCKETLPKLDLPQNNTDDNAKKEKKQKEKPEKQKNVRHKNKKLVKTIIVIIILAVVAVSAFVVYRYKTKNLNANDPILRIEGVINTFSGNPADYVKYLLPEMVASDVKTVLGQLSDSDKTSELVNEFSEYVTNQYESWKDTYGDDLQIKLSILYKDKLDTDEIRSIEDYYAGLYSRYISAESKSYNQLTSDIAEKYGIKEGKASKVAEGLSHAREYCSTMQIQDGYDMVVRVTLSGRQSSQELLVDVYVIRVDGTWSIDMDATLDKLKTDKDTLNSMTLIK